MKWAASIGSRCGGSADAPPPHRDIHTPINLTGVSIQVGRSRGKAAVTAILQHVGAPLTQSEIGGIMLEAAGLEPRIESVGDTVIPTNDPGPDRALLNADVRARVTRFVEGLTETDRKLLVTRGYGHDGKPRVSHRLVAERLPGRSAESYRLLEHGILRAFADRFPDREEMEVAVSALVDELSKESSDVREEPPSDGPDQTSSCA